MWLVRLHLRRGESSGRGPGRSGSSRETERRRRRASSSPSTPRAELCAELELPEQHHGCALCDYQLAHRRPHPWRPPTRPHQLARLVVAPLRHNSPSRNMIRPRPTRQPIWAPMWPCTARRALSTALKSSRPLLVLGLESSAGAWLSPAPAFDALLTLGLCGSQMTPVPPSSRATAASCPTSSSSSRPSTSRSAASTRCTPRRRTRPTCPSLSSAPSPTRASRSATSMGSRRRGARACTAA